MELSNRIKNAFNAFKKQNNSVGVDGNAFLKYGHRRAMPSTWTQPEITDQDFYTGYGFAVINKRANRSVTLGKNFLYTKANDAIVAEANKRGEKLTHPYLELIRSSEDFSERDFWYNISTYLDLEGIFYLMAVRTVTASGLVGNVQKFTLLNPYNVRAVVDSKGVLGGYIESRPGTASIATREIPKEMIIPIKLLNPFNPDLPYSLADAARDSQFTLKQANDYARESINGNINAPGIISTSIELPDDQFDNFVDRIKHHGRGEPLFGNGAGTVDWVNMQTDLDKAALDKINSISRDALLAVSGTSKSGMGVEEAGAGREVSRTQKDDFTENAVMPQVENIIDALNLDYRRYYQTTWKRNGFIISLDNPLETDREAEQADVEIRDSEFNLLKSLLAAGYTYELASKYAKGLIDITDLGEPTEKKEPVIVTIEPDDGTATGDGDDPNQPDDLGDKPVNPVNDYEGKHFDVYEGYPIPVLQYLGDHADQIITITEKGSFIHSTEAQRTVRINRVEAVGDSLIAVVDENTYIKLGEFNNNADRVGILAKLNKRYHNQPVAVKKKIELDHECDVYEIVKNAAPIDKQQQIAVSASTLQASAEAAESQILEWYLDALSAGQASPHLPEDKSQQFVNSLTLPFAVWFTVMFPIFASQRVRQTADQFDIKDEVPIVAMTAEVRQMINDFARKEAMSHINTIRTDLENAIATVKAQANHLLTQEELKAQLQQAFVHIQARRAQTIANNAAARIFNISQYEADLQFLTRAGKLKQAYKVMFSLTGTPCPICKSIIAATNESPIPFKQAFVNLGETIESEGLKMTFNYEQITAGNVHPNCHCAYRLIIQDKS